MPRHDTTEPLYQSRTLPEGFAERFAVRALRQTLYDSQPPERQAETRARVERALRDEFASGQRQPSYLCQIAQAVYGVDPARVRASVLIGKERG